MADPADIAHLLRRTEFVARPARVTALSALTLEQAVDDVLNVSLNGSPTVPSSIAVHNSTSGWEQYVEAVNWWLDAMVTRPRPFQERMALFWHGHFTSSWWDGIGRSDHMMAQNQLFRTQGLGNFRALTQAMALQPAMLVYLNNNDNRREAPNQNFARELMELFTLGVGNYTEADVEASSRAWTGFNADWPEYQYQFHPTRHDSGNKTFFGTTRAWTGPQIIDEILRDNPPKKEVAARFIVRKLWDAFAHPGAPAPVVDALAAVFLSTDLDIRATMRALLLRPEFYGTTARQGLVRTPIEWMVALLEATGLVANDLGASWMGERLGQSVYNPPNVAGWKHNAYWLTTSTLSARGQMARNVTWRIRTQPAFANLASMTPAAAVDHVAAYFRIAPLSTASRDAMVTTYQNERTRTSWAAPVSLLTMAMLAPEMHMA
ncbi:MAG: DUF1800 family protein [Actinobacteria bacterium]|uniref:Unannotated protein n=1 Tax=freshwater metagenome TaxID=449393 RepID=A0A6J6DVQ2_9ZZZZ|nr:DUF1800 family protein [Actinomycetota bacterium]